jgi:hypothetical protein
MNAYTSAYSHDSGSDNNLLALPEEGMHGARKAAEELRHSAQEGAANPLRTRTRYAISASDHRQRER